MCHSQNTTSPFRLACSKENAMTILRAAVSAEVAERGRKMESTADTVSAIEGVSDMLTSDSGKFGIMFCGQCGNGKSTMAKAIGRAVRFLSLKGCYENPNLRILFLSAKDLFSFDRDALKETSRRILLAIEDLGEEPKERLEYGNVMNPVVDVLEYRYDNRLFTIVTTNLTPAQIAEKYGRRIADRCREMFEVIVFKGQSFR